MINIVDLKEMHPMTYEWAKELRQEGMMNSELSKNLESISFHDTVNNLKVKMTGRLIGFAGHQLLLYKGNLAYFNNFDLSIKQLLYYNEKPLNESIDSNNKIDKDIIEPTSAFSRGFLVYGDQAIYIPADIHTMIYERQFAIMQAESDQTAENYWKKLDELYKLDYIPDEINRLMMLAESIMDGRINLNKEDYREIKTYLNHCEQIRRNRELEINKHLLKK